MITGIESVKCLFELGQYSLLFINQWSYAGSWKSVWTLLFWLLIYFIASIQKLIYLQAGNAHINMVIDYKCCFVSQGSCLHWRHLKLTVTLVHDWSGRWLSPNIPGISATVSQYDYAVFNGTIYFSLWKWR